MQLNRIQDIFSKRYKASDPLPAKKAFTHEVVVDTGYEEVSHGYLLNGGYHVVIAPTGCGKSTYMSLLCAATYKGKHMNMRTTEHLKGRVVIFIDTETPRGDFVFFQRDVVQKLMGLNEVNQDDYLWSINLTHLKSIEDKRDAVYEIFEALGRNATISLPGGKFFDLSKVGLVVLDNIADICVHTTDESGIRRELEEFKHYVEKCDRPVLTVKHADKKGNDAAGRSGTLVMEKSSGGTKLKSAGPGEPSTVTSHKGVRGARPFRPFEMYWDKDGTPIIEGWEQSVTDLGASLGVYENDNDEY